MNREEALEILRETYDWSINGQVTVWNDFVNVAHNTMTNLNDTFTVDFGENYGYTEFVLFGKCLSLFEDRGYDEITELIDYVLYEIKEKSLN